jgi:4-amino-4-deoxy-L-arabinose transferase-like glycosyltransferase
VTPLRKLGERIGTWPIALLACVLLAATILLPCLGSSGLWEPSERQLADRVAPPLDVEPKPTLQRPGKDDEECLRTPPKDAAARSLRDRSIELGRDTFGDTDAGRRLPFALFGLITALAAAGIAMRGGGGRAGVITVCVLLAMPMMTLQSRMLTSDIGTACGQALLMFALFGLARPNRRHLGADLACSALALCCGFPLAFLAGGALLGLLVPIGAFAAAGSLGVPLIASAVRGRFDRGALVPLLATLVAIVVVGVLAYQMYYWTEPYPGLTPPPARQMFGKAVVSEGCWSSALGAIWRAEDDIRFIFDSTFEQIAYGTFPWGVVGPIAMFMLLRSKDPDRRLVGALTLAWAAAAWIATEAFQRRVGNAMFAGFPALAVASGVWIDDLLTSRTRRPTTTDDVILPTAEPESSRPGGVMLIALFVGLAVLDLGKDLQSFTDKLTSLLTGSEIIAYPKEATALVSLRLWVLVLGVLAALGFALSLVLWRTEETRFGARMRKAANVAIAASFACTITLAAFWSFVWQPVLAYHLSSKELLATYDELRTGNDPLYVMGDLGYAPAHYTDVKPEPAASREQIVAALKKPARVFAIAPQGELCTLHREMGDQPYFVLEDRNTRNLLLSNKVDGATDKNPLQEMIAHKEPKGIKYRPKARVVFDNKLELLGWDIPPKLERGDDFEVVTYWKVLAPVGGAWTMLLHFDGPLRLRDGDHKPIKDRCPTSSWQPGDFVIDRHPMKTGGGGYPPGKYELWIGFFTGSAPNFRNMTVSAAPGDMRDTTDRVKIASLLLD